MLARKKKKLHDIEVTVGEETYTAEVYWQDTSFAHEFGTQVQGQWEVESISYGGADVTDTVSERVVESILEHAAGELGDLESGF